MSDPEPPKYRTGPLWAVLAVILFVGTLAAAYFVWGLTSLLASGDWLPFLPVAVGGAFVASVAMLLVTGILYRVDRFRGVPTRRIELFE